MHERLKEARKYLKLSQEFVAPQMHLSRPTISAIESGQRKVTAEELDGFLNCMDIWTINVWEDIVIIGRYVSDIVL